LIRIKNLIAVYDLSIVLLIKELKIFQRAIAGRI